MSMFISSSKAATGSFGHVLQNGKGLLPQFTTGSSIFIGQNAGASDDGSNNRNIGIGKNALDAATTGQLNIAIGDDALTDVTTGNYNVAIGFESQKDTTGGNNTSVGYNSLEFNTSGNNNVAIGYAAAGGFTYSGADNIAIGFSALGGNSVSGDFNIAIGKQALNSNTAADDNLAIGDFALTSAGTDTNSNRNIAIGSEALRYVVYTAGASGYNNTALGWNAGKRYGDNAGNLVSASYGVYIGHTTYPLESNSFNEILIGSQVRGKGSNTATIGDGNITDIYLSQDQGATVHTGNVSGSATSTGSFGLVKSGVTRHRVLRGWYNDNEIYDLPSGGDQGIRISKPTPTSGNSSLPIQFTNYFVEIRRSHNTLRLGGYNGSVQIYDTNGTQNIATFSTSGLAFSMGSISGVTNVTATGNISGSATSTGSFGSVFVKNQSNIQFGSINTRIRGDNSNNVLTFMTNNTERVRINDNGMGIGGDPVSGTQLTVYGSVSGSSTSTGSFGAGYIDNKLGIGTTSPGMALDIKSGEFEAAASSGNDTNGIARFGQASGDGALDIGFHDSGDGYSWLQSRNSANYAIQYHLVLQPTGKNVGIGQISPSHKLDVTGTGRFTGTLTTAAITTTGITSTGNISGSATSTGSFGRLELARDASVTGTVNTGYLISTSYAQAASLRIPSTANYHEIWNSTNELRIYANQNSVIRASTTDLYLDKNVTAAGNVSGSATSTGSFGVLQLAKYNQGIGDAGSTVFGADAAKPGMSGTENTAIGSQALTDITSGAGNTAVGREAGANITTGGDNVAIGKLALYTATSPAFNVAIGNEALRLTNTGGSNVGIGRESGYSGTTHSGSVFIGERAGYSVTTGNENIAIGHNAMNGGTITGNDNIAIGSEVLDSMTSGTDNIGIGHQTLTRLTTGVSNIAMGNNSLGQNTVTGNYNVAIGYFALGDENSGHNNVAIGYAAGRDQTGVSGSVFIGENAGHDVSNGQQNIAIGKNSMYGGTTTGDNNIAIGVNTGDALTSGKQNVLLGGEAGGAINSGYLNTVIGHEAGKAITSGIANTILGWNAGLALQTGHNNVFIGREAGKGVTTTVQNVIAIGHGSGVGVLTTGANASVFIGASAGAAVTSAQRITAVGYQALGSEDAGSYQTAVGYQALSQVNNDNGHNVALGQRAGYNLTTGYSNTLIGSAADASSAGGINQIVIGQSATGVANNSVTLGNASVTAVYMAQDSGATVYAGGVITSGNVSGSATSTGSFGNVFVGKGGSAFSNTKLAVIDNNSTEYAPMGGSSNTANAMVQIHNTNSSATAPHSLIHFRLDKSGGDGYIGFMTSTSTGNIEHFVVGNQVDGEIIRGASGGNVGIGDSNPSGKLVVSGSGTINLHIDNSGTGDTGLLGKRNATSIFGMFDDASDSKLRIVNYQAEPIEFSVDRGGSETIVMTMLNSGDVGIGETSPSFPLDVVRSANTGDPLTQGTAYQLGIRNSSSNTGAATSIAFGHETFDFSAFISAIRTSSGNHPTADLTFGTRPSDNSTFVEHMRIISDGDIGINTTSVTQQLAGANTAVQIKGELVLEDGAGAGTFLAMGSAQNSQNYVYSTGNIPLNFSTNGGVRMTISGGGNVGIGDTNPAQNLVVSGSSKGLLSVGLVGGGSRVTIGDTTMDSALYMRRSSNGAANVQVLQLGSSLYVGATSNVINTVIQSNTSVLTVGSSKVTSNASIEPTADASFNLGAADKRWANIFSADLQLSNEGTEGNEVDGTTGSWTIQEGEDDLYLLNRKNGKKYKFKLEEIT